MRNGAIFISEDTDVVIMSGPLDPNPEPTIERIATLVQQGIMSPREARETLERMSPPPQIINFPGETEEEQATKERILRLYAQGLPIREIVDAMAKEGYTADTLLRGRARVTIGSDPAVEIAEPMHTFQAEATGELESGDLVVMDGEGNARRAREGEQIIGVALNDRGLIRFTGGRMNMSWANRGSMAYHASIAYGGYGGFPRVNAPAPARYQYNERFPKEVVDKAMALLERFMSADQYKAFMEGVHD